MNACDVRIHLEANLAGLPVRPETCQQALHVRGTRKRAQETAVARFDYVGNSSEAAFGQQCSEYAALPCTSGMQALHHCALLSRHQSRAQRSGDTECMLHLRGIEP